MTSYNHLVLTGLLLTVQIILGTALVEAQNTDFSFTSFSTPDSFLMVDDVVYAELNSSFLMNSKAAALRTASCGRLLYKDKVRMKDSASGAVASFQTAFTFQITGPNDHVDADGYLHGEGLAFTFARNNTLLDESTGSSLCLLKEANNGMASNRLFAVEFDTYYSPWLNDSSDSHIGVNINSLNSTWSYNFCGGSVKNCSYLYNGGYFTAWIDYHRSLQKLVVFFANGSLYNNISKPLKPLIEASLPLAVPLAELVDDYMFVGFSASTGSATEVNEIQSWSYKSSGMPDAAIPDSPSSFSSSSRKVVAVTLLLVVFVGAAAVTLLLVGLFVRRHRWRASHMQHDWFNLMDQNFVPRMFTYKELSKATKNFSRSELLGSGRFGAVYEGTLPSGALVAVKRMKCESKHGEDSFQAEAASLSQILHRNLVQLRGWCHEKEQLFLVYDYMRNGSLDEWLFHFSKRHGNEKGSNLNEVEGLPLKLRHSILSGVAAALSHLHQECALHRNIKSSNVLLDGDKNAYLGDFGVACLIDHQKMEITTLMAGTLGYMAPEMLHTGKTTKETDVYSFGILMLEVMCGTRPLDVTAIKKEDGILVDRVWRAHEAGNILNVVDSKLGTFPLSDANLVSIGGFDGIGSQEALSCLITKHMRNLSIYTPDSAMEDKKMITNLLHLGLLCCNPNPKDRPSMRRVSRLLQSAEHMEMSMPPLPISKPQAHCANPGLTFQSAMIPLSDSTLSSVMHVEDAAQGFPQSAMIPLSDSTLSSVMHVEDAAQGSSQSTPQRNLPLTAIVSDVFQMNSNETFLKVLQNEVTKLHYISKLLSNNYPSKLLVQSDETIVLFNFNEENVFEFYFKDYKGMACIIGVGLQYAKVILKDGWQMKVQEISKQKWEYAWKHFDSTSSAMRVTIPKLPEVCVEDMELSQKYPRYIPQGRSSLLLDIAKYFILTTTIASFPQKDTIINANSSSGGSSSSQSTHHNSSSGGSSSSNGNNILALFQAVKNIFFPTEGLNELKTKDDSGIPADPPSNHGMNNATTVHLQFLPGGCLLNATNSDDKALKGFTSQLDNTISSEMEFTFINDDMGKEIQIHVGPISFEFQKENDNYEKTGRFGWFHQWLDVSFGVVNAQFASLSTYRPLDVEKVKRTKTTGSASATTNGTTRTINGSAEGSVPGILKLTGGGSSECSTTNTVCDNVGVTTEKVYEETKGEFSIIQKAYRNSATLCYTYLSSDHTTELDPVNLRNECHRKKLHNRPICIPQEVKFHGTWRPNYLGNDPEELVEYTFKASRVVQMTSKLFEEPPKKTRLAWIRKDKQQVNRSEPLLFTQNYVKRVFLNHAMTHLDGGVFKVRERWTLNRTDPETYLTEERSLDTPAWAGDDPLVELNRRMAHQI